jgi:predicted AAA+ superfamily ATPase
MIKRTIETVIKRYATIFPAIGLNGPRQSGKTTLARQLFPHLPYVLFEDPDVLAEATANTRLFVEKYRKSGAIFDEVQYFPIILSYLQGIIDDDRDVNGRFVITGSQHFALNAKITQSLAGRIGMLTLLPLSLEELGEAQQSADQAMFHGGYPGIHKAEANHYSFFRSYTTTYVERDARQLQNIPEFPIFVSFMRMCAYRIGQELNVETIANDLKVPQATIKRWFNVLEAGYLAFRILPYYNNFNKRLIGTPKLYFYDTGLVCHLLNISSPEELATHEIRGRLFENLVALEIVKGRENRGFNPTLCFWRDTDKNEVDLVVEWGGNLKGIEVKSADVYNPRFLKNADLFKKLTNRPSKSYVVYAGSKMEVHDETKVLPYTEIPTLFDE